MTNDDRKKVSNLYMNPETHATLKALAAHKGMSMQATAAELLEEMQPVMQEMVQALDDIKKGKNTQKVLGNYLAKSLHIAASALEKDNDE